MRSRNIIQNSINDSRKTRQKFEQNYKRSRIVRMRA